MDIIKRNNLVGALFFAFSLSGCFSTKILTPEIAKQELRSQGFCSKDLISVELKNGIKLGQQEYIVVKEKTDEYIAGWETAWVNGRKKSDYRKIYFRDIKHIELRRVDAPLDCLKL
jgi:hypothetical protein